MSTSLLVLGPLAALAATFNFSLGRLRAGAGLRSHRRFGLLAASALLVLALRHVFGLTWSESAPLIAAMLLGQLVGRRGVANSKPTPLRWRTATYAVILTALFMLLSNPIQARTGNDWKRLDADEPAPAFTLTSQDGKRISLKDFRGKAVVLTFIYTACKDICPVLPQIIDRTDQVLSEAERKKVHFVGVSIDPRRDTPEKLRSFMQDHKLSPDRWTLLTGSLQEASKVADDYGILAKPDLQGDLVHNAVYVLIDTQGRLRTEFHGLFTPTQEIAKALRQLIATPTRKGA